jgi:hypothetical protein
MSMTGNTSSQYIFVYNTTCALEDRTLLCQGSIRSRQGPAMDGDPDQVGIYIHKADLAKAVKFYEDNCMMGEAEWVGEALKESA